MEGGSVRECDKRPVMVMAERASSSKRISPTDFRVPGRSNGQTPKEKGDRERAYKISEQSISCSEERLTRGEVGDRPISTECLYSVPNVPHAYNARSEAPAATVLLDCGFGPQGRVLAYPSIPSEKTLSGVRVQRPTLEIQVPTLRVRHCTKNLYKGDGSRHQDYGIRGHIRPDLFGRFAHNLSNTGKMSGTQGSGYCNIRRIRVDNKYGKIPSTTSPDLRLVRSTLGPGNTYDKCYSEQHGRVQSPTIFCTQRTFHHKALNNASPRVSSMDWAIQPNSSYSYIKHQNPVAKTQVQGVGHPFSPLKQVENQYCQMGAYAHYPYTARQSTTYDSHPNRCLTQGLGIPNRSVTLPRRIRSINEILLNKHTGVIDNMVCFAESNQKGSGDTDSMRQLDSSGSCSTQHNNSLSPINNCRADLEESNQDEMDSHSISHPREIQYCGGPTEQEHNTVDRMVSTTENIQGYHENEPQSANRLVRHTTEQSTGDVHLTMSGPESNSSGCYGDTMEQVGPPIPLSPVHYDFEGFTQTTGVTVQERYIDNTRHPNEALVYGTESETDSFNSNKSVPTTMGSRQVGNSPLSYKTPRVEVIKQAYGKEFPGCPEAVTLMATPIRKSSEAEYEKKWSRFMTFVEGKNIPFEEITVATVISFLTQLFHERHLSPNTVAHYKSALAVPLQLHFNIDLSTTAFRNLLRAMYLQRPNQPVSTPAWSLDKVLTFMEGLTNPITLEMLLKKTAFLLMLATGWRISELHACVRDQAYCYFTGDGILHIRPHPSFLAKNECSQRRWDFKEIKSLRLGDGSVSKLCPVATTQEYLRRTHKVRRGSLFLTPNNNSKTLTVHKLTSHICQIIRLADPVAKIKVHEVRKYASSLSFINSMIVGDLTSAMNWKSPAAFFKFYFSQVEPTSTPVIIPVSNQ